MSFNYFILSSCLIWFILNQIYLGFNFVHQRNKTWFWIKLRLFIRDKFKILYVFMLHGHRKGYNSYFRWEFLKSLLIKKRWLEESSWRLGWFLKFGFNWNCLCLLQYQETVVNKYCVTHHRTPRFTADCRYRSAGRLFKIWSNLEVRR